MDSLGKFLSSNGSLISSIPMILFLIVILVNILRGILRGFRKNLILTIISFGSFIIAYIIYLCVFRSASFESFVLKIYKSSRGESLNETLNVPETCKRFKTIISSAIEVKLSNSSKGVYHYFTPYVEAMSEALLGLVYMVATFIVWWFIYFFIGYLIIYLVFFSERKYKKSIINGAEDAKKESLDNDIDADNLEAPKEEPKAERVYKKRRLLGGAVGLFKGIVFGLLSISVFGTLFYISTGMKTDTYEKGDTVTISVSGKDYDLTDIYKFFYEYDKQPFNKAMNNMQIGDVPVYASFANMFCKAKVKVSGDGVNTTIYPVNELAGMMKIMHNGVELLDKYNVKIGGSSFYEDLSDIIENNPDFVDELYKYIKSIGDSKFHRAIGRTITNNFVEMIESTGKSNKYVDAIFKGENAIKITDIGSKDDIKQLIRIISKALIVYREYDSSKDVKEIIINDCDDIKALTDELLKLSIFSKNTDKLNGCVSDLLELAFDSNKTLKDVSFENIDWFGDEGEISKFITTLSKFLCSDILVYNEGNIKLNYSNIGAIYEDVDGSSVIDDLNGSEALRRVMSTLLISTELDGITLYIPDICKDSKGYISAEEYDKLFSTLENLLRAINFSDKGIIEIKSFASLFVDDITDLLQNQENLADIVIESNILSSIASKYLYDTIKTEYTMPTELSLEADVVDTNITKWIGTDGELYSLLKAVNVIGRTTDIGVNAILSLKDEDIDKLCSSTIINVIITQTIEGLNTSDLTIIIPEDAYENGYISKSEVKGIMHSVKAITGYDDLPEVEQESFDIDTMNIDPEEIISNERIRAVIFESLIIEASISYKLVSEYSGMLTIPSDLAMSESDKSNMPNWIGADGELYYLINGIFDLNLASVIGSNTDIDINAILENANIESALESRIIWNTISSNIISQESSNTYLSIPSIAYQDGVIKKSEIIAILNSIKELEKSMDTKDVTLIDANMMFGEDINFELVLASTIIWYSVSKAIIGTTGVTIPTSAYVDIEASEKYILKAEISNVINALRIINQTDIENISLDSTTIFTLDDTTINKLLLSYIVWYEISYQFRTNIVNMPEGITELVSAQEYVIKDEIKSVIHAMNVLGISNMSSYNVSSSIVIGMSESDIRVLISSRVVWYEISRQLILSDFVIPEEVVVTVGGNTYLEELELIRLMNILKELSISSFGEAPTNPTLISGGGYTNDIAASIVMRTTLSKIIFVDNNISTIGLSAVYAAKKLYNSSAILPVLTEQELINMIESLAVLNITTVDGFTIDLGDFLANPNRDKVLESYTIWLYVSDLLEASFGAYIPDVNRETYDIMYYESAIKSHSGTLLKKEFLLSYASI